LTPTQFSQLSLNVDANQMTTFRGSSSVAAVLFNEQSTRTVTPTDSRRAVTVLSGPAGLLQQPRPLLTSCHAYATLQRKLRSADAVKNTRFRCFMAVITGCD